MKRIMLDMDDVICYGGFLKIVNEFLKEDHKIEEIKTYYIQDLIPKEKYKEWAEFFNTKNVYDYCEMLPDMYEILEKLSKKYEIYITTAFVFRDNEEYSANSLKYKYEWLYENLPFISPNNYIFTTNKEIIDCEIKIDDKLSNLKGKAETKLLFTAHHNKEITDEELKKEGAIRVNNWKDIEKILLKENKEVS